MDEETTMRCSTYAAKWDQTRNCSHKGLAHTFTEWQKAMNFHGYYRYCTTCGFRADLKDGNLSQSQWHDLHDLERITKK